MEKAPEPIENHCEHEYAKKSHEKVVQFMEYTLPEMHTFIDDSKFGDEVKVDIHTCIDDFFEKLKDDAVAEKSLIVSNYNGNRFCRA